MTDRVMDPSFFRNIDVFDQLDTKVHQLLAASVQIRHYPKGKVVFVEGEPADRLYAIVRGRVRIYQSLTDGREYTLEILGPGELLAIVGLFDDGPYPASAVTLETCTFGILFYRDLKRLMQQYPEAPLIFLRVLSERMRRAHRKSTELALRTVHERLASTLLSMYEKRLPPVPATELARLIGSARETVTRALHDFERHGAVEIEHGRIRALHVNKLKSWLSNDPKGDPNG